MQGGDSYLMLIQLAYEALQKTDRSSRRTIYCHKFKSRGNSNCSCCSRCDFIAHLDCTVDYRYRENINLQELKEGENEDPELDQFVDSRAYKVKNIKEREDGIEIAIEI